MLKTLLVGVLGIAVTGGILGANAGSDEPATHPANSDKVTVRADAPRTYTPIAARVEQSAEAEEGCIGTDPPQAHNGARITSGPYGDCSAHYADGWAWYGPGSEWQAPASPAPSTGSSKGKGCAQLAEDGSCVRAGYYDRTEGKSKGKAGQRAEDGSRVNKGFYDRTDYNRNGVVDQDEGCPPRPRVSQVGPNGCK